MEEQRAINEVHLLPKVVPNDIQNFEQLELLSTIGEGFLFKSIG